MQSGQVRLQPRLDSKERPYSKPVFALVKSETQEQTQSKLALKNRTLTEHQDHSDPEQVSHYPRNAESTKFKR